MINFGKLNLTEAMDPIEQSASDKAVESGQKKKDPTRTTRQKSMMAQPTGSRQKSNVVYANEEMRRVDLVKAYNRQKCDWRQEIAEDKEQDPNHPYIDVMPMTNGAEERAKKQMKLAKKTGIEQANKIAGMAEEFDFEAALGKLVDEAKETDNKAFQMVKAKLAGQLHDPSKPKPKDAPRKPVGDKAKVPGMFDHSKRND